MRNVSASLVSLVQSGHFAVHLDVLIERPLTASTSVLQSYRSYGGEAWTISAEFSDSVDQNIGAGSIRLARDAWGMSLAPLVTVSILNEDSTGAYAPAIDVGREVEIRVAVTPKDQEVNMAAPAVLGATALSITPLGYAIPQGAAVVIAGSSVTRTTAPSVKGATSLAVEPLPSAASTGNLVKISPAEPDATYNSAVSTYAPGNWMVLFQGVTGDPEWQDHSLHVPVHSRLKVLADVFILDRFEVGSDAGTAVEVVVQQILDRMVPGLFTVKVKPSSPGFLIRRGFVEPQSVYDALQALVGQYGGRFSEVWDDGTKKFELTLVTPPRNAVGVDYPLGPGMYISVPEMKLDTTNLRTIVRGKATDRATGQQITYQIPAPEDVDTDPGVLKYGPIPMQLADNAGQQVDSMAELQTWVAAAYSDVATPTLLHAYESLVIPWLELDDRVSCQANGVHYDEDQIGAVIARTFSFSGGSGRTRMRFADKAKGRYALWQLSSVELFGFAAIEGTDPTLYNLTAFGEVSGARTAKTVTIGWEPGAAVAYKFVYDVVLPVPLMIEPRTALFASVPLVLETGTDQYTLLIPPRGQKRFVCVVPRGADMTPGRPQYHAQDAVDQPPVVNLLSQVQGSTVAVSDVTLRVEDPQNRAGTLLVWTNKTSPTSADIAQTSSRVYLASTPADVGPSTMFTDGSQALDEIQVHAGQGKRIFAQFTNDEGVSSDVGSFQLQGYGIVEKPGGGLTDGIINGESLFDPSVKPPLPVSVLPPVSEGTSKPLVYLISDQIRRLYRFSPSLNAYTAATDGQDINPSSVTADKITVATLAALSIDTGALAAGILQNATSNPTAIIRLSGTYTIPGTATRYLDLAATGSGAFLKHPALELRADGTIVVGFIPPGSGVSIRSTAPPVTRPDGSALQSGDQWIETDAGDKPYSWSGSAWVASYTQIDGGSITTGTVNAARISIGATTAFASGYDPTTKATPTDVANAKQQVSVSIRSATAPTQRVDGTPLVTGDQWIDTANGNKPYSWNTSVWVQAYTQIDGGHITTGTIAAQRVTIGSGTTFGTGYDPSTKATPTDIASAKQQVNVSIRSVAAPTLRPDGTALVTGDQWLSINSGNKPYSWNGSVWVQSYTEIDGGHIITGTVSAARISVGGSTTFAAGYDPTTKATPADVSNAVATGLTNVASVQRNASAPTTRADGTTLRVGDLWIETDAGDRPWSWNGSAWAGTDVTITPGRISTTTLSAIVADLGTVTAGLMQNLSDSPTAAIRLNSGYTLPGSATTYIDLAATGTGAVFNHPLIQLRADGSGGFAGPLTASTTTVNGSVLIKAGTATTLVEMNNSAILVNNDSGGTRLQLTAGGSTDVGEVRSAGRMDLISQATQDIRLDPASDFVDFRVPTDSGAHTQLSEYLPIKVGGVTRYIRLYS